ncbi:MAG: sigma-70 family RNA polymerase sigma factor [Candidatus Paceibacterota bacterium]|jgi:RNA polymerase sigma-70 factor (ECF subfamily)
MREDTDEQLVTNYLKGDEKSLEILISRYLKPIYNFVYRYVKKETGAEDITQEIFIKAWRNLKRFDKKRSFKIWLFHLAKNICFDFLRKRKDISFSELRLKDENYENHNIEEEIIDTSPLPDELFRRKNLHDILNSAIEQLPLKDQTILFLYYNDHFTLQEIANSLDESLNTVKSRYFRALKKLRIILSDEK